MLAGLWKWICSFFQSANVAAEEKKKIGETQKAPEATAWQEKTEKTGEAVSEFHQGKLPAIPVPIVAREISPITEGVDLRDPDTESAEHAEDCEDEYEYFAKIPRKKKRKHRRYKR